ncbi:NADH:flavin oxidoreductase/NADH oxidase [Ceratobasidium sp. AG-Ba]|nr:NADH:flavin oxidoreductase/NADH oxidase [Ceratobasidium sp. AG-Ba]
MTRLFTPLQVGDITLGHRIVMAPMTRMRASDDFILEDVTVQYYAQRSVIPGTLIISEATLVAEEAIAFPNLPGIWNEPQITGWRKVVNAVHANKSFIYLQIGAGGRIAYPELLRPKGLPYVSSSPIGLKTRSEVPIELSKPEIERYIKHYAQAARNAVYEAGADGVEIHACNGGLVDQFLQDVSNNRTDEYGGSIENRSRFALEVIEAVTKAIGESRVGIRLSPWTKGQGMGMRNPIPTYTYLISELAKRHPGLAYLHMIEPGIESVTEGTHQELDEGVTVSPEPEAFPGGLINETKASNEFAYNLWTPRTYMTGGGYTTETAVRTAENLSNTAIAIGRMFISNPDLPRRMCSGSELRVSDKGTHYTKLGPKAVEGYIDYPSEA